MKRLVFPLAMFALFPSWVVSDESACSNTRRSQTSAVVLDINQATAAELAAVRGIGPKLASQIVAYREKHGPFRRVEELLVIRGIGSKKWKTIRPHLRVSAAPADGHGLIEDRGRNHSSRDSQLEKKARAEFSATLHSRISFGIFCPPFSSVSLLA